MDKKLEKYKEFIEVNKTTDDLVDFREEMDKLVQSLFHTEIYKFEETLNQFVRVRVATEIRRILKEDQINAKEHIKAFLEDLYKTITTLPILKLQLSFEPSEMVISDISHWARNNLERGILLDLTLERTLLGGAVIVYNGKFYDYSVRKKLKEIFEKGDLSLA